MKTGSPLQMATIAKGYLPALTTNTVEVSTDDFIC